MLKNHTSAVIISTPSAESVQNFHIQYIRTAMKFEYVDKTIYSRICLTPSAMGQMKRSRHHHNMEGKHVQFSVWICTNSIYLYRCSYSLTWNYRIRSTVYMCRKSIDDLFLKYSSFAHNTRILHCWNSSFGLHASTIFRLSVYIWPRPEKIKFYKK